MSAFGPFVIAFLTMNVAPVLDDTPAQPPPPAPHVRRDPKQVKRAVAEIVRAVTALDALPELSRTTIERVLGVSLVRSRAENAALHEYEVSFQSGPFIQLRFRESDAKAERSWQILAMDARMEMGVNHDDFDKKFIGPWTGSNPNVGTYTHSLDRVGKRTLFAFGRFNDLLVGIYFHRNAAANRP